MEKTYHLPLASEGTPPPWRRRVCETITFNIPETPLLLEGGVATVRLTGW
jgi:hypothetical protein